MKSSIQIGVKQADALLSSVFNFASGFSIRKFQESQDGLELMEHISFRFMLVLLYSVEP
jgi:hypothetical protein